MDKLEFEEHKKINNHRKGDKMIKTLEICIFILIIELFSSLQL